MKHNDVDKKITEALIDEELVAPASLKKDVFSKIHSLELLGSFAELFFKSPLGYLNQDDDAEEKQ